jgi:hypothetical protein
LGAWFTIVPVLEVLCLSYVIDIEVISVVLHACQNSRYLGLVLRRLAPARGRRYVVTKEPLELALDDQPRRPALPPLSFIVIARRLLHGAMLRLIASGNETPHRAASVR